MIQEKRQELDRARKPRRTRELREILTRDYMLKGISIQASELSPALALASRVEIEERYFGEIIGLKAY